MKKFKYLNQPVKNPKKFIKEMDRCVKKKYFLTVSKVIRNKKVIKLIRKFNETAVGDLKKIQIQTIDSIYQGCLLIDHYNALFFKDIKVKFIEYNDFREMQLKFPYAKLQLQHLKK